MIYSFYNSNCIQIRIQEFCIYIWNIQYMSLKRNWIKIAMFYLRDEQLQTMISAASSQQKQHSAPNKPQQYQPTN